MHPTFRQAPNREQGLERMKGTGSRADLQPGTSPIPSAGEKCCFLGVLQGGDTSQCVFQGHKLTQVYCAGIQLKVLLLIKTQSSQVTPICCGDGCRHTWLSRAAGQAEVVIVDEYPCHLRNTALE